MDTYKCMDCVHYGRHSDKCCCELPCRNADRFYPMPEKPAGQKFGCLGCDNENTGAIECNECTNQSKFTPGDIILTENGGLQEHQKLLKMAENCILFIGKRLSQYKIDRMNARSTYDDLLSTAKISAIAEHDIKPGNQTIINAYASADKGVQAAKQEWLTAKALEIKAKDRLEQLQGQRDTIKALVKSEHGSY